HHHGELRSGRARPLRLRLGEDPCHQPEDRDGFDQRLRFHGPLCAEFKAYENVAQAMGGAMSTTGLPDGAPFVTGAQIGDTGTGLHLAIGLLGALHQATRTGQGQYVEVAMMDGVMNLCRVKFRDHQRLQRGALTEYSVPTYQGMEEVPRAGNVSCGWQLGNALHCKPHGPNDWLYIVVQEAVFAALAKRIGPEV